MEAAMKLEETPISKIPQWILYNSMVVDEHGKPRKLEMDKKAVRSYFLNYVNQNTVYFHDIRERLEYLTENGYYETKFLSKYTYKQIQSVFDIVYGERFRFESYMSAFKVYHDYTLKTNDNSRILERYEDRLAVIALYHANGNIDKAQRMARRLIKQDFTPATPTLLNTGRKNRGEYVSCFILRCSDSLNDIGRTVEFAMQLSKRGGGVSIELTDIRARGESLKKREGVAKGAVATAKLFDQGARFADQMGQRQGAFAVYYNIFGADVEELLSAKSISADMDTRLVTLSIGLSIPDKFYELAAKNEKMYLFYPHNVHEVTGKLFSEIVTNMDEWYDKLVANPRIRKRSVSARGMLQLIAVTQSESGYPYILNVDNVNKVNALADKVLSSNLCTEILQPSLPSFYADYDKHELDIIGMDISCNLSSLSVRNTMEHKSIEETVYMAMDVMNSVADNTNITLVPGVAKANRLNRSVGLGAMDLAGYLAINYIPYGSEECIDFVDTYWNMINFYSLKHSMMKAKETGSTFYRFEDSAYADGRYFENRGAIYPKTPKVQSLFNGIHIPTQAEWEELAKDVQTYGLYNSHRLAIAPTGSISYAMNATPSVTPVKNLVEERTYGNSKTYYPMPKADEVGFMYETSYDIDKYKLIDVIATIQKHVDQGISFELNIDSTMDSRELQKLYLYAHHKGIKTLYYTRTRKVEMDVNGNKETKETAIATCESCAV